MIDILLDRSLISAPSPQYVLEGTSSSLRCSYPGSHVTWLTQGQDTFSGSFPSATYEDGGVYMCDIYVPSGQTSVQVQVTVFVVGKNLTPLFNTVSLHVTWCEHE